MADDSMDLARKLLESADAEERRRGMDIVARLHQLGNPLATYAIGTWYLHGTNGFEKDEDKGVAMIRVAAEHNIVDAVCDYAYSLEEGIGAEKDERAAMENYLIAAILGDEDALHDLARCFDEGIGIEQDEELASRLFAIYEIRTRN